jgi:hypothetical protein
MATDEYDFSGVWLSTYRSTSTSKPVDTEHYVVLRNIGNQLVVESMPNTKGSYLLGRFTLDGRVATGSFQSQNSPHSSAKGALYYGAAQLVMDEDGKAWRGMSVGFGKSMEVKSSHWQLVHVGQHKPAAKSAKATGK